MTTLERPLLSREVAWANGTCGRGHDITDPANVYVMERDGEEPKKECIPCRRNRQTAQRERERSSVVGFPPRICVTCGDPYYKTADTRVTMESWAKRRFCSTACGNRARAKTRITTVPEPKVNWDLASCQGSVKKAADDVFFEPESVQGRPLRSRTDEGKAHCRECPIRSECLQYALARGIQHGIWGGIGPAERDAMLRVRA